MRKEGRVALEVELAVTLSFSFTLLAFTKDTHIHTLRFPKELGAETLDNSWCFPGAYRGTGAPLDLSVEAAAVFGQNGPQWT